MSKSTMTALVRGGMVALGLVGASVAGQAAPPDFSACEDAGLFGPALGLCQAFYAVDCLNDGDSAACDRIEEQYEALGMGPIPGVVPCPCWSTAELDQKSPASKVSASDWEPRYCDNSDTNNSFSAQYSEDIVAAVVMGSICMWIDTVDGFWQVENDSITLEEGQSCVADLHASDLWQTYCQ